MYIKGTCEDMCPISERRRREKENLLHKFEVNRHGAGKLLRSKAEEKKMIKEFSRSAAGRGDTKPEDVRTPETLRRTMHYMIKELLPRDDVPWIAMYDFVFDRIRAVRQDLVLQQAFGADGIEILEVAVRFYIYSSYRLCDVSTFDPVLNSTHLQECLKHLIVLYQETSSEFRAEITSYYVLHNLNSTEAVFYALTLPSELRHDLLLETVLKLHFLKMHKNYYRVFRLAVKLEALQLCVFNRHIHELQMSALKVLNKALCCPKPQIYPLEHLSKLLFFCDVDAARLICTKLGISVTDSGVQFSKKTIHLHPEPSIISKKLSIIDQKLQTGDITSFILGKLVISCDNFELS